MVKPAFLPAAPLLRHVARSPPVASQRRSVPLASCPSTGRKSRLRSFSNNKSDASNTATASTMASDASPPPPAQLFAVRLFDRADSTELRAATRDSHLEWARRAETAMRFAGPMRISHDDPPFGSLLVMASSSEAALEELLGTDPYAKAGLFERHETRPWRRGMASAETPAALYAVWCVDRPDDDALALRAATRPKHLQWWKDAGRDGMIGPFPNPVGEGAVGTLIVCSGESVDEVREWATTDPYNQAGLFSSVDVCALTRVIDGGWEA